MSCDELSGCASTFPKTGAAISQQQLANHGTFDLKIHSLSRFCFADHPPVHN
jgi:hypothetical protein